MSDVLYAAAREHLIKAMTAEALASLTVDQRVALTAAVPGRMPEQLLEYWTRGEGAAKIRWGTDGSFDRCVRHLRKYFRRDPKGLCAKLHKRATGEWPAEKGIQSSASFAAPSETEYHLPGQHPQSTHGNRPGKSAGASKPSKPALEEVRADDSAADKERRARAILGDREYERRKKAGKLPKSLRAALDTDAEEAPTEEEFAAELNSLAAHAGEHTAEEVDSMDAALAYLDEPDEFAESLMPMVTHWSGMLAPVNKPTGDRRIFEPGAMTNRDLPLPLMWQELSDDGHRRSSVVGTIETLDHREDGTYGTGRFLDPAMFPDAEKAMALLRAKVNGPSVDLDDVTYSMKNADGTPFDPAVYEAAAMGGEEPAKPLLSVSNGRISGATLVSIPAFAEVAHTWNLEELPDEDLISAALGECEDCGDTALAASAGYVDPPLAAFLPRDFAGPTPLTVTDDGLVFGHLATWSTCHVGFPGTCVTPPQSKSSYAYFHTSEVRTAEGERLPVGPLVLGAPHADLAKGFRAAAQHYDQTGAVAALVRVYEDAHGIAFSGVLVRDLDEQQRAQFATLPLSGDWRRVGGSLELIAAISVPVPGFPVARSTGKDPAALVAAGMFHSSDPQPVDEPREQPLLAEVASTTVNADGTISVTFRGLEAVALRMLGSQPDERTEEAAEVAGPDVQFDVEADYAAAMELLDATLDRERMALLDGINPGE